MVNLERAGWRMDPPWRVIAVDTKRAAEDAPKFAAIGPTTDHLGDVWRMARPGVVFRPSWGQDSDCVGDVQALCAQAYERGHVTLYIDEYKEVVESVQRAGASLQRCFQQGRGRLVGVWGATQEPVFVPRQLLSQATHVCLFDLFYPPDQDFAASMNADWRRPPDLHGFWYVHVDGRTGWQYYPDKRAFFGALT